VRGDGSSRVGLGFIHVLHSSEATVDQSQNKVLLCYLVLLLTSIRLRALGLILAVCLLVRIGMLKIVRSQTLEVSPCCLYTMGGTYGGVRNHGFAKKYELNSLMRIEGLGRIIKCRQCGQI
jgi:hypothetical protein